MVRDDFWMAVTRFLRDLEVELVQGQNLAAVDLFDVRHAKRVLKAYGRAYGALPEDGKEITPISSDSWIRLSPGFRKKARLSAFA